MLNKQTFGCETNLDNKAHRNRRKSLLCSNWCTYVKGCRYWGVGGGGGEKPEESLCDSCNVVDNEVHFLCQCKKKQKKNGTSRLEMMTDVENCN